MQAFYVVPAASYGSASYAAAVRRAAALGCTIVLGDPSGKVTVFPAQVYLTVPSGGATIAVQVTYADQDGAQTLPILTSQAQAAGKWSSLPAFFEAVSGTAIDVQVQSSVITTTLATAAILEA